MSNKLTFGKYEGKTLEWLFFNKPSYAQYIHKNKIHWQEHSFDEQEGDYFAELYRRATHLGGICGHFQSGDIGAVGFYCDECGYFGGSRTGYYAPSFIVEAYKLSPHDQKMVLSEIRRHYITANLTQGKIKAFFIDDANFTDRTPGFFGEREVIP